MKEARTTSVLSLTLSKMVPWSLSSRVLVLGTIALMVFLQMLIFISNLDNKESSGEEATSAKLDLDFPFLDDPRTISYILTEMNLVFFLHGVLPGQGRSALAQAITDTYKSSVFCCSSQSSHLEVANHKCLEEMEENCKKHIRVIVIDHADSSSKDLKTYFSTTHQYNYTTVLIQPNATHRDNRVNSLPPKQNNEVLQVPKILYPLFYGWFLGFNISLDLQGYGKTIYDECLQQPKFVEIFNKYALPGSPRHASGDLDFDHYFSRKGFLSGPTLLHCTSFYSNYGIRTGSYQYATSSTVRQATGGVYNMTIIGFLITPQSFGARLDLTKEELLLWGNDNGEGDNNSDSTDESMELNSNKAVDCPKGWHPQRFSPTCGPGSRAHITLGTGVGISAKQTGPDLNIIIQKELNALKNPKGILTLQLADGIARAYGNGYWAVYLNRPLKVGALFSEWN